MDRKNVLITAMVLVAAEFITLILILTDVLPLVQILSCLLSLVLSIYVCAKIIMENRNDVLFGKVAKFFNLGEEMYNESEALEQVLFEHHENTGYTVIDNILTGKYKNEKEIDDEFSYLNFDFPDGEFMVLIMGMEYYDGDVSERSAVFKTILDESYGFIDKYVFVHSMPNNMAAYIIQPNTHNELEAKNYIYELVSKLRGTGKYAGQVNLAFGSSGMCRQKQDIHIHFKRAMEVMHYNIAGYGSEKLWYGELQNVNDKYYLPLDTTKKLLDYTIAGNKTEITNTLDYLYNENFLKKEISIKETQKLIDELSMIVERIVNHINDKSNEIKRESLIIKDARTITEVFSTIQCTLHTLCDKLLMDSTMKNRNVLNKIQKYVDDNYMSIDLSLTKLSMHFHLSENYISMIFKKYAGENFSRYLEDKRISEACILISNGDVLIKDIAEKVGYGNDVTFRRAFKRSKGMSPTDYKSQIKKDAAV